MVYLDVDAVPTNVRPMNRLDETVVGSRVPDLKSSYGMNFQKRYVHVHVVAIHGVRQP